LCVKVKEIITVHGFRVQESGFKVQGYFNRKPLNHEPLNLEPLNPEPLNSEPMNL
jgi:hypothetical protein